MKNLIYIAALFSLGMFASCEPNQESAQVEEPVGIGAEEEGYGAEEELQTEDRVEVEAEEETFGEGREVEVETE